MAEHTEAEVVRNLALETLRPVEIRAGHRYLIRDETGALEDYDLTGEMPARKTGIVVVRDVESFAHYYAKHSDDDSEVFADIDMASITAVLDAHQRQSATDPAARWQEHRLTLQLTQTLPWQTWMRFNRQMMPQGQFAEFLEDNYGDLHPEGTVRAADFLEMAQSFQATTKVDFESGQRLDSGDTELTFKEITQASAGRAKKIAIPTEFELAIAPYEDCAEARIRARFRYRATQQGLLLGYFLNQPERVAEAAVKEIVGKLSGEIGGQAVMYGQAAHPA